MGLFRSRAKKKREQAAAEVPEVRSVSASAPVKVPRREVAAETRPDPDRPGWGRTIGREIGKPREERASQE
jgi:hypothetical protein